jgi:glycine/D-amino acid oxidase-like deaminating enzyme
MTDANTGEVIMNEAGAAPEYSDASFWFDSLAEPVQPLSLQALEPEVDVAIVGAGYTGLWTAYYLKLAEPALRIAVLEAEVAGFGASGRNGGWCFGESAGMGELLRSDPEQGMALARAMFATVDEIERVCDKEDIDCHFDRGGYLTVAHTAFYAEALEAEVARYHSLGFGDQDYAWLAEPDARARVNTRLNHGAMHSKHGAAIHPARLARGLAQRVRDMGVVIHELTPVTRILPGVVQTTRGSLRAGKIVRATEGYTDSLQGEKRKMLPLYSVMVATEPLPESAWDSIGLAQRETFGDARRMVIYGQRTRDNRLAFGGRGGYRFGSARERFVTRENPEVANVEYILRDVFPVLEDYRFTHGWGGVLGVPRNWRPCVSFSHSTGIGTAGGYVGDGVAASNLGARILCDLMLERNTELTRLSWVDDTPVLWEPEPLRWLGYMAGNLVAAKADAYEMRSGRPARISNALLQRLLGWS